VSLPERVAIRAAKSEGALPPFRDEPSDHGLDGRVFEAYLCFRGAASISDLPAKVLVRLRDFWEMHLHWCMAWRALRERICYNSKAGGGA